MRRKTRIRNRAHTYLLRFSFGLRVFYVGSVFFFWHFRCVPMQGSNNKISKVISNVGWKMDVFKRYKFVILDSFFISILCWTEYICFFFYYFGFYSRSFYFLLCECRVERLVGLTHKRLHINIFRINYWMKFIYEPNTIKATRKKTISEKIIISFNVYMPN